MIAMISPVLQLNNSTEAGQALREDAQDVRKVIDKEIEDHDTMQYRPPPGSAPGIPPAVSYSPNTGGHPHQPPPPSRLQHQHRPDPPEAEGVTGYRQPPLNYYDNTGPPPPTHGYPHHPPPPPHHHQGHLPPPSNYYGHHPSHPAPPQFQQHPPQNQQHFPQPLPQFQRGQNNNHHNAAYSTQPHQRKKQSFSEKLHDPANMVHSAMDAVSGMAGKMKQRLSGPGHKDSMPPFMSTGTDFTMSDVSNFTTSNTTKSNDGFNDEIFQGAKRQGSNSTKSGSANSKHSFNMSDLSMSGMGFSFGRTRSFPDLMLSTGDIHNLLPAFPADEGGDSDDITPQRTSSGRILRPEPHARNNSSGSSTSGSNVSLTIKGFHPVRGRANTQNTTSAMSGLNDAMSIMSIDSQKLSLKSESSSWMENLKSMQSIHTNDARNAYLHDDSGSVRSLLSDISNDLNALDLAEPLLPPFQTDGGMNDSGADFLIPQHQQPRPDP